MSSTNMSTHIQAGEPTWGIASLFPNQGHWAEGEYLDLNTNHLIEFSQGVIEVLAMPSYGHQLTVAYLYKTLSAFLLNNELGEAIFAPLKVKLWEDKFREPDIVFMLKENHHRIGQAYWQGADLVMEVVSPDDPKRDTEVKRVEYAKAGILEYWLVNPINETITVFTLLTGADAYEVHGKFGKDEVADSILLSGFKVEITEVFSDRL